MDFRSRIPSFRSRVTGSGISGDRFRAEKRTEKENGRKRPETDGKGKRTETTGRNRKIKKKHQSMQLADAVVFQEILMIFPFFPWIRFSSDVRGRQSASHSLFYTIILFKFSDVVVIFSWIMSAGSGNRAALSGSCPFVTHRPDLPAMIISLISQKNGKKIWTEKENGRKRPEKTENKKKASVTATDWCCRF